MSSQTKFTGAKKCVNLEAQVLDDITYSVGLGIDANKGALSICAGFGYTISSDSKAMNAQATARYTF